MNPTTKRLLLIVALIAFAALVAFGLYSLFFKKATPSGVTGGDGTTQGGGGTLPTAGERTTSTGSTAGGGGGTLPTSQNNGVEIPNGPNFYQPEAVTRVVSDYASFTSLDTAGTFRYQNQSDGKFYGLGPDGTVQALSDQVFFNVQDVTWAKNANKAVLEYPDGSKIVYNFDTKTQATLPKHWEEFSFSPDSSQIAAKSLGLAPENRWLVTTNDDGTGTKLVEPLGDNANRVNVDWSPSRQTVALARTGAPQGADRQEVLFVGLNGENFKSTVVEGLDFQPKWSPSGRQLLYSVDSARSDFKPELWVVDAYGDSIGSNRRLIKLNTWAEKCSFAGDDTLFCAVPQSLPQGAGMSPAIADSIPDDVYKIDLATGIQTLIPTDGSYHITNMSYDAKNNKVLFTDRNQAGVYQINL